MPPVALVWHPYPVHSLCPIQVGASAVQIRRWKLRPSWVRLQARWRMMTQTKRVKERIAKRKRVEVNLRVVGMSSISLVLR
jgi:hypothetical protein